MDTTFILHIRDHHCSNCSHGWTSSDLFKVDIHGSSRTVEPFYGEPLAGSPFGISRLLPKTVAVCYRCAPAFEMKRRQQLDAAEAHWQETLKWKALGDAAGIKTPMPIISAEAKRRAAAPSIEEL
jgi:hypothetical protein